MKMNLLHCFVAILMMSSLIHSFVFPISKLIKFEIDQRKKSPPAELDTGKVEDKIPQLNHTIDRIEDIRITLQPNGTITAGNGTIATANRTTAEILKELEDIVFLSLPRYG